MNGVEPQASGGRAQAWVAAMLAVAATYVYFLIFAEFALLELARTVAPTSGGLRLVMTALGAGGVAGAWAAARVYQPGRYQVLLAWAFRAAAIAAALTLWAGSLAVMMTAAAGVGLALGAQTVVLTSGLRSVTGGARLGWCLGTGTGLAYALCNLPAIFRATPAAQAIVAVAVAVAGSILARRMVPASEAGAAAPGRSPAEVSRWLVVLTALVWMDSAAFYVIQHRESLRSETWGDTPTLVANALVHLFAAMGAGALLDRGLRVAVVGAGGALLAVACLILDGAWPRVLPPSWLYTAGVSLYSTVLVEFPARTARAGVAALVFAIAGWIGSALGIGMAQDLERVPVTFVVAAAAVLVIALGWRRRAVDRAVAVAMAVGVVAATPSAEAADAPPTVSRGREVYIAEGCIHCHSQYVRPRVADDLLYWGPSDPIDRVLAESPPLLGARRLGPDLSHVGNRRTAEWNRLHLIAPRAISPGSRMPSYAHLFVPGDERGPALVEYLASLGAGTIPERQAQMSAWVPASRTSVGDAEAGRIFGKLCSPCHGVEGRGDGVMAARLSLGPANWSTSPWRHVPAGADVELVLARIIKFGLPGLPMAGHEYLPDPEVVGLARFVRTLHKGRGGESSASDQQ